MAVSVVRNVTMITKVEGVKDAMNVVAAMNTKAATSAEEIMAARVEDLAVKMKEEVVVVV